MAFSESGKMVAIGANSGTLRLFNTASLLENKDRFVLWEVCVVCVY